MTRAWKPPTPCEMVCPDCSGDIPRGSIAHDCALGSIAAPPDGFDLKRAMVKVFGQISMAGR